MIISQDPLVEIDPTLCQNVSCTNLFYFFFAVWDSKMAAVTKNSAEQENEHICRCETENHVLFVDFLFCI